MAHVGDLIVTGAARCLNTIYAPGITTLKYSGIQTSGGAIGGTFKSNSTSEDDAITIQAGTNMTLQAYSASNTLVLSAVDTTYSSKAAASGGTDVSLVTTGEKYTWNNKTSNTGTVTSITLKATSPIAIDSTSAITTSGTRTLSHANSGVTAGTYQSVTVNATGHVTAGSALTKAQVTTALGYTPPTSDTNNAVTQTATNTNANYEVLFSATADNTTRTEGARKYSNLLFNPSTGTLTATKFSGDISGGTGLTKSQVTTALGYTPPTSDTNNAVTQTATDSTDANYELLFSATADNKTRTEGARKSSGLLYNPNSSDRTLTLFSSTKNYLTCSTTANSCIVTARSLYTSQFQTILYNSSGTILKSCTIGTSDVDLSGTDNTWDGTNTSLKTALSKKLGNTGSQTITNGSVYISTSTITTGVGFFAKNRNNIQCYLYCGDDSMGLYSDNGHGGIIRKFLPSNEVAINGATYSIANPANFRSAIGAAASSSRLTKKNIEDITEAEAKKILDIDVKSFDYKDTYILEGYPKRDKYYGVIAEDVLKQIPFVVNVPDDYDESKIDETKGLHQSLLTIDYDKFVPYLIKMVQIQQKEIEGLKQQLNKITK